MRRFIPHVLCLLVALSAPPAAAQQDSYCDPSPDIPVTITPIFDSPQYNTSHSFAAIRKLSSEADHDAQAYDSTSLGLAHYIPVYNFTAPIRMKKMADGAYCVQVQQVDANIGYRNITIYIAHELVENDCAVQHVIEHEKKHVAVNREILLEYVPSIQARLREYLKTNGVYSGTDAQYAQELMQEKIRFVLMETSKQITTENRRRQSLVDTPEEYAKNIRACDGYINNLVLKARNKP